MDDRKIKDEVISQNIEKIIGVDLKNTAVWDILQEHQYTIKFFIESITFDLMTAVFDYQHDGSSDDLIYYYLMRINKFCTQLASVFKEKTKEILAILWNYPFNNMLSVVNLLEKGFTVIVYEYAIKKSLDLDTLIDDEKARKQFIKWLCSEVNK